MPAIYISSSMMVMRKASFGGRVVISSSLAIDLALLIGGAI